MRSGQSGMRPSDGQLLPLERKAGLTVQLTSQGLAALRPTIDNFPLFIEHRAKYISGWPPLAGWNAREVRLI
jgi:hypothetical protein